MAYIFACLKTARIMVTARGDSQDVVEALEGPISITPCERGDDCQQLQMCSVRDPLLKIKAKVVRVLGDTSIYELATN